MNTQLTDREALLEQARLVGWCASQGIILRGSISVGTENQWRSALSWATAAELQQLLGSVESCKRQQDHDREWQADFDAKRQEREAGPSEAEQAELNQMLIEARVAAQDAQRPATREQVDRLIAVNERLAAALERK